MAPDRNCQRYACEVWPSLDEEGVVLSFSLQVSWGDRGNTMATVTPTTFWSVSRLWAARTKRRGIDGDSGG